MRIIGRRAALLLASSPSLMRAPRAQAPWPAREVRIIVGFPAGGPLDIAARTIAPPLAARLGVAVPVDNGPGRAATMQHARWSARIRTGTPCCSAGQ